jgi:hypothetical protein
LNKKTQILSILLLFFLLQGCAGTIIGTAVDATIEVAKIPFKVGGAIIDGVTGDDDDDEEEEENYEENPAPDYYE